MTGRVWGYARVSSTDQNLERQRQALEGVDVLIEETASGKNLRDRSKLSLLLEIVQPGDTIRVKSIDRLARSTSDMLAIVDSMVDKGVAIEFIDTPQLSVSTKEGRAMLTIFAAFAQLERETIRERQAEGIAAAKAAGRYVKAPKLSAAEVSEARRQVEAGVPKARVARSLGVSRQTLYCALNGTGPYAVPVSG